MPYASKSALPPAIRKLPEHAQSIYRKAFNAAFSKYGEQRAHAIAWAAVKNLYKKVGERWVRKSSDSSEEVEMVDFLDLDSTSFVRDTSDGYQVYSPRIARTGIQEYCGYEVGLDSTDVVRVYRPEEEVFDQESLRSIAHRPVTIDHPDILVDASNWKSYAVGYVGDEVLRDGQFIRVPLVLMDADAIKAVKNGKSYLSLGYTAHFKWEEGKAPDGQVYDGIQTAIRANHLAVVSSARGGSMLRLGDEEERRKTMEITKIIVGDQQVDVAGEAASIILRHIKGLETQVGEAADKIKRANDGKAAAEVEKAAAVTERSNLETTIQSKDAVIATKDAEIATLRQEVVNKEITPQKLDRLVKDRAEVIAKAQKILGSKLVVDGKTDAEIRRQVVDSRLNAISKDWDDRLIEASFNTLTVDNEGDALSRALSRRSGHSATDAMEARNQAYADYCKQLTEAWKSPAGLQQRQ